MCLASFVSLFCSIPAHRMKHVSSKYHKFRARDESSILYRQSPHGFTRKQITWGIEINEYQNLEEQWQQRVEWITFLKRAGKTVKER